MIHISLPSATPIWIVGLSLGGTFVIGSLCALVRLARAALPVASVDRLDWWTHYWEHRRDLRHERWKRRDERHLRRYPRDQKNVSGPTCKRTYRPVTQRPSE